jgi:hypothetical protein
LRRAKRFLYSKAMRHSVEAGSHRLYSADLVYFAAVLLRLSGIGISVNLIGSISKQLWGSIEAKSGRF